MQDAIAALGFESVVILQPSLLVGDRSALGQPLRAGEVWGARLMGWLPRSVRPIPATRVAEGMLRALTNPGPDIQVIRSGDLH